MSGAAVQRAGRAFGRLPVLGLLLFPLLLGACSHHGLAALSGDDADNGINAFPANYKSDILAAMHAYLNDPTAIHDAAITAPVLKSSGAIARYIVCVKFNAKKNATQYEGVREIAARFLAGRFDQFIETPRDLCTGAAYTPFPELQKLPP
jgi:hypothetical protein